MTEKTISTLEALFGVIEEYCDKGFYFRGENKDYGETACLPPLLRDGLASIYEGDVFSEWFKEKMEELGVGLPCIAAPDASEDANEVLADSYYPRFYSWGIEKFKALMKHYHPDFKKLYESELESKSWTLSPSYLDITSDIMVALHFACSEYHFLSEGETQESLEAEKAGDGVLFIFDLKEIEKAEFLKLVSYPSYSYFCKEKIGGKLFFQSFDRITHQRGAFLVSKINEKKEIKETYLHAKITIKSNLKKELYEIFGKDQGLEYYFPRIPCTFPKKGNKSQQRYKALKGITLLEKKKTNAENG
jgi:hypothetical protein